MELAKIVIDDFGGAPAATHNMPCAVCLENHAVYLLTIGAFKPCWPCIRKGWVTTRVRTSWWARILWRMVRIGPEQLPTVPRNPAAYVPQEIEVHGFSMCTDDDGQDVFHIPVSPSSLRVYRGMRMREITRPTPIGSAKS